MIGFGISLKLSGIGGCTLKIHLRSVAYTGYVIGLAATADLSQEEWISQDSN